MELNNRNIAMASCYEAPYGSNFIRMLTALAERLKSEYNCKIYLIFPEQPSKYWITELQSRFTVGFTRKPYRKSTPDFLRMFHEWQIDLVHTHFEAYDEPVAKAVKCTGHDIHMVWHLHDNITLDKTGLSIPLIRKLKTHISFWLHYGYWGKKAYFVPVSTEVGNIENHYRNHFFSFPNEELPNEILEKVQLIRGEVVINGIDMSRIEAKYPYELPKGKIRFLTFGGHTIRKGIPTILDAAEKLESYGIDFMLSITKGVGTLDYINQRYANQLPTWLVLLDQTENICALFDSHSCFISAALKETMSMAIAEASIYGLPVIQSNIAGTWWNSSNPSTFLFHVGNADDLSNKMIEVIKANRVNLKEKCRETSENNYMLLSMQRWCGKIIEIYKKV